MEGSKTITLTILYDDIIGRVQSGSYYVGEAAKGKLLEVAAMLQASSDDDTVIKDFLKEASSKACNVLQRYVGTTAVNTENATTGMTANSIKFTTDATVNFEGVGTSAYTYPKPIENAVADYVTNYILREWTKPIPATSNIFAKKVVANEQTIRDLCCYRNKPTR